MNEEIDKATPGCFTCDLTLDKGALTGGEKDHQRRKQLSASSTPAVATTSNSSLWGSVDFSTEVGFGGK